MAQSASLAFSQGLVDRYVQMLEIRRRDARDRRYEQRYTAQLQSNQRWRQQTLRLAERRVETTEESLAFRKTQALAPTDISFGGLGVIDEFAESYISSDPSLKTSISPGATSVSRDNIIASWNRFRDTFRATAEGINASPETISLLRDSFLSNIQKRQKGSFRFGFGGGEFDLPDIEELQLSGQQTAFPSRQGEEDLSQLSEEELRRIIEGGQ